MAASKLKNDTRASDAETFSHFPTGTVMIYASEKVPPVPWLLCDGSAISRALYPELFNTMGTKYGAGDGISTFNLPDFRGRVVIGVDHAQLRLKKAQNVGLDGGKETQKLSVGQIPAHTHGKGSIEIASSGSHTHQPNDPGHNHGGSTGSAHNGPGGWGYHGSYGYASDQVSHSHSIPWGYTGISIQPAGSHSHSVSGATSSTGNNEEFEIIPPFQTANYIIYAG